MRTFESGAHELVDADSSVQSVNVAPLGASNQVQRTLVGVRHGVRAAHRVVVCRTVAEPANTTSINAMLSTPVTAHMPARVCNHATLQLLHASETKFTPTFYVLYNHNHWRRQLWGTGARAPLDFQLVILGITRFTDSDESCARFSVQYRAFSGHRFCRLSKTTPSLRNFYQFLAHFCHFLPTVFLRE